MNEIKMYNHSMNNSQVLKPNKHNTTPLHLI